MTDKDDPEYSIRQQCELLSLNRAGLYYKPVPVSAAKLGILNRIDELYTMNPAWGGATIGTILRREGHSVSDPTVRRYMREMGLAAIYPGPNLSKRAQESLIYPYLLRGLEITRPNQVWGTDITYIRMKSGFVYLVAFMDWYSRYVISWELSDNLQADFVLKALRRALLSATPEIANSDQGSQFTSLDYTALLKENNIKISMDGRGRCMDNIFSEMSTMAYTPSYKAVENACFMPLIALLILSGQYSLRVDIFVPPHIKYIYTSQIIHQSLPTVKRGKISKSLVIAPIPN